MKRTAFTLIEVLVASTIAAMLVTVTVGLALRLESRRKSLHVRYQNEHRVSLLREIIQRDVIQSDNLIATPNRLFLSGPLSTDERGAKTLLYADVIYSIEPGRIFTRIENDTKRDQLWVGVDSLEVLLAGPSSALPTGNGPSQVRVLVKDEQSNVLDLSILRIPGGFE